MGKILIVEDENPKLFEHAFMALLRDTHELIIVTRGDTAVDVARKQKPDLIIMDLGLPGLSGIDAILQIRQFNKRVPIFAVTAYTDKHTRARAMKAGASLYEPKPLDLAILTKHVEEELHYEEKIPPVHGRSTRET